ncbi:MAG TPA: 2-oxo acid dehydrogenase subunit E2, partial [Vicinamibacterales bacterium]|nr:2-oxo acid dehydrogenase subunit E2 [Vicinamibacterales bacterium]
MTNIVVPELGESVVEARVARWLKKEGERVEVGDPVVELETEKIDLEVNADRGGVIMSIKHKEGDDVKIGEVLAVMDETASASQEKSSGNGSQRGPQGSAPQVTKSVEDTRATPTARNVAKDHDVNLASIQGSGAAGRVMKQDVQKAITATRAASAPMAPAAPVAPIAPLAPVAPITPTAKTVERREERQRMSKRRATIARRLVEAQHNAAMLTTFNEVDMSAVMALRERRKEPFKLQHGVSLGIASFFVKASIAALRAFPLLNAEIQGDEIVIKHDYDIGLAVG